MSEPQRLDEFLPEVMQNIKRRCEQNSDNKAFSPTANQTGETGMLKQRRSNRRQKTTRVTLDILPEERIVLFDMKSQNTTTLKVYHRFGGLAITFRVPSNIRICKER